MLLLKFHNSALYLTPIGAKAVESALKSNVPDGLLSICCYYSTTLQLQTKTSRIFSIFINLKNQQGCPTFGAMYLFDLKASPTLFHIKK
jgi:hypothetical protein